MTDLLKDWNPLKTAGNVQESNYIQNIDQSVTQNGVTVTLTDSIRIKFPVCFFEVKTEDSISMTDHTSLRDDTFKIDGKKYICSGR